MVDASQQTAVDPTPIISIIAPDQTWPVWMVMHTHPTSKGGYPNLWTTMIDPSDGRVLGQRDYKHSFVLTIYRLHYTLLLYSRDWMGWSPPIRKCRRSFALPSSIGKPLAKV